MAKMFYTLSEAAERLGMSEDEVKGLTESGQLQEFRDRDQIMLKVEQVDLLAGTDDDAGGEMIPLAESGELEPIGLSSSGSGSVFGAENPMEATGISIFDPEVGDEADPSAATQVSGGVATPEFDMDAAASGTGMSGVALEADDTSVGSDLLEDVYGSGAGQSGYGAGASGSMQASGGASDLGASAVDAGGDLFESAGEETELTPAAAAPVGMPMAEAYDGPGSGLVGGLALGIILVLLIAATIVILSLFGAAPTLLESVNMTVVYGIAGGGAVFMLVSAAVGWVLLRKS